MELEDVELLDVEEVELLDVELLEDELELELDEDEELELLEDEPPDTVTVVKAAAGTGSVPVHAANGAAPHPAGVGTPGTQAKVTEMTPPGPTNAVVELAPRLKATSPPEAVQVVVGKLALTANGVAVSSPEFLFAGVGSVIVVVPVTDSGGIATDPSVVFAPNNVRFTSAGMLFTPTDNRLSRYPVTSTDPGTSMPKVAPDSVIVSPPATELGVAAPLSVIGSALVPGCALLVQDVGVVTVAAPAGAPPTEK